MRTGGALAKRGGFLMSVLLLALLAAPFPAMAQAGPAAPASRAAPATPPKAQPPGQKPAAKAEVKIVEVPAHIVIETHGAAKWDDGYGKIVEAIGKLQAATDKANLKVVGRPLVAFTETDDAGFKFKAMLPVDASASAKFEFPPGILIGQSPSGKAVKFHHTGAYEDIDSTYEAITAYLEKKRLEARGVFVEQYLNDVKNAKDKSLQVDIYVFLKKAAGAVPQP